MVIRQYDIWLINLDPTVGSEIRRTRPCVVISPDEMHQNMRTLQIAPLTSNIRPYPWRVPLTFQNKKGVIAPDQIRTVDRQRAIKRMGKLKSPQIRALKTILHEMLIAD